MFRNNINKPTFTCAINENFKNQMVGTDVTAFTLGDFFFNQQIVFLYFLFFML